MKIAIGLLAITACLYSTPSPAEEESSAAKIGPDKGIMEAKEDLGIKLSSEAMKNFEIKTQKIVGTGPWMIPQKARVTVGEDTNLFRLRDGFFKRIAFETVQKGNSDLQVRSEALNPGDEIVIQGTGYLRITELAAFGESSDEKGN